METTCGYSLANGLTDPCEFQRPERGEDEHDADRETPITDSVHHERFLCGIACAFLVKVVPDQQVRTEAHAFPPDKHHQIVVAQDKHQHREHKEVEVGEESVEAVLFVHVADRVNVNQETNPGHH